MARWPSSLLGPREILRARHNPRPEYTSVAAEDTNEIESSALLHVSDVEPGGSSNETTGDGMSRGLHAKLADDSSVDDDDHTDTTGLPKGAFRPTDRELVTLRKVSDTLPWSAFLVALVELCERFAYYGLSGPFQNYMQNSYGDPAVPGAIGLGQKAATRLSNFFQFWCYVTPIGGAIVADQFLGRYRAIFYSSLIYITGIFILFATSLPQSIEHGLALPGLLFAMVVIGLGTGGIKSNVSPLIAEQYRSTQPYVKTMKSGERVIVDPSVTIQRIYMIFYLCINVGSLSSIATTTMELHIGFWSAFLLPLCMFIVGLFVVVAGKNHYVTRPPKGSAVLYAFRAIVIALRHNFSMNAAKPSYKAEFGGRYRTPWDDQFVEELKRALIACKVFLFYPVYWLVYGQMVNNFVSQAGQMELRGIPNDIMQNIDALTIISFIPICDRLLYPFLRKIGIPFRPITRITWGFLLAALSMAYAAVVQHWIYSAGPCYRFPLECVESQGGSIPNHVHIAWQTPAYLLIALSEIFASVTGLEYAYTKAPESMKSFIMSIFLLQTAFGAALGIALSSTAENPKLVWMYSGLSATTFAVAMLFWFLHRHLNATEDRMNALEGKGLKMVKVVDLGTSRHHRAAQAEGPEEDE